MASVGTVLREARSRQGVDLAAIAEDLRITQRYLECIEKDDFKSLPGVFFYKAFVKQYALRLGLDADAMVREAERLAEGDRVTLLPESAPTRPSPVVSVGSAAAAPALRVDPILAEANERIHSQRRFGWSAVALGVVVIGCTVFYAKWYQGGAAEVKEPLLVERKATEAKPAEQKADTVKLPVETPTVAPGAVRPQEAGATLPPPAPLQAQTAATHEITGDGAGVTINLAATEATWIEVTSGGKVLFTGLLNPSETRVLKGSEQARLVVGNAGGLSIQLNGKPIGPVGPRGQVRYVQFKKDNYEVLLPNQVVNQ